MSAAPPAQPPKQPPPPHFLIQVTCQQISAIPDPGFGGFSHPGTLMGPKELTLLQQRATGAVAAPPPFQAAVEALKAATPIQYSPHAIPDILMEWDKNDKPGIKIGEFLQQVLVNRQCSHVRPETRHRPGPMCLDPRLPCMDQQLASVCKERPCTVMTGARSMYVPCHSSYARWCVCVLRTGHDELVKQDSRMVYMQVGAIHVDTVT
jgi:hypothetical protein